MSSGKAAADNNREVETMQSFAMKAALCASMITLAGAAEAVTVNVTSISGVWGDTEGTAVTAGNFSGDGGSTIEWGIPCCGNISGEQSSYVFEAATTPILDAPSPFDLGTFTHNNFTISVGGGSISSTRLFLSIAGEIDGVAFALNPVFDFDHFETPNGATPCAAGGSNPCPDLVTLLNNRDLSETIQVGSVEYTLTVLGFDTGAGPLSTFLTQEAASNSAVLRAAFRQVPVSEVPIPAAGWLLVAGLAGLAALRRTRG